jgi:flagellar biosynthetic protein FliR
VTFAIDQAWATASALLWLRLAVLFFLTPLFSGFNGPASLLALLSLTLAGILCASNLAPPAAPTAVSSFAIAAVLEVGLGAMLAFGVHAAFAAFGMAGQLLDVQIGFASGNVFDPVTRANTPILGATFNALAVVLFFALDAHQALLRGIAFSVEQIPPGTMTLHLPAAALVREFGAMFTLALTMAAPVFFALLLLEVGMVVVSRMLPQMNVYFVGLPLKIMLGLAALAASAYLLPPVAVRVYASIFQYWEQVLR